MRALIIGATGATGREIVREALNNPFFSQVIIFVRKSFGEIHPKLKEYIVDFENMGIWKHLIQGDVAFSALGTTLKTAGSKEAQWKIDYEYQHSFAKYAQQNRVPHFLLVSSQYANAQSNLFYVKMKGQLDEAVRKMGFVSCHIFKPPVLDRPNSDRSGERLAVKVLRFLSGLGILKKQEPLKTSDLAKAMIQCVVRYKVGYHEWGAAEIRQLIY